MLGVVIGRFQTPYLTKGHQDLFDIAFRENDEVLILIGNTSAIGTDKNPLSYKVRAELIDQQLSNYRKIIQPLSDSPSDADWSKNIDDIIEDLGFKEARIYGGRDNSIEEYYSGKHSIKIIETIKSPSATEIRKNIGQYYIMNAHSAAGIIYHIENRYPIVYSTIDVAIFNGESILMGKKGDKFSFIGGFVDTFDENLVLAASRETFEETGFNFLPHNFIYHFSKKVEDRRYINTKDSIMTHFFSVYVRGKFLPNFSEILDKEFKEFAWIDATEKSLDLISDTHKPLFLKFINSKN